MKFVVIVMAAAAGIAFGALSASAESFGSLTGRLMVDDRMPVACEAAPCSKPGPRPVLNSGIKVTFQRADASKKTFSAVTNARGAYRIALPKGRYDISLPDYTEEKIGAVVHAGRTTKANFIVVVF